MPENAAFRYTSREKNGLAVTSMAHSDMTLTGSKENRAGDYFTITPDPEGAGCFSAFGAVTTLNLSANPGGCSVGMCSQIPRYMVFCPPVVVVK